VTAPLAVLAGAFLPAVSASLTGGGIFINLSQQPLSFRTNSSNSTSSHTSFVLVAFPTFVVPIILSIYYFNSSLLA
jgi:hypothetical protein